MFEFDQISPSASDLPEFVFNDEDHWVFVASIEKKNDSASFNSARDRCLDSLTERLWGKSAQFVRNEHGKPFLFGSSAHISLSHTKDKLAFMVSKSYSPGIDIEDLRPSLQHVAARMLSPKELSFKALREDFQTALQYCWGAKEAVYKSWGLRKLTFKTQILLHDFVPQNPSQLDVELLKDGHHRIYGLKALRLASGEYLVFTNACQILSEPM